MNQYSIGDKVKITDFYSAVYPKDWVTSHQIGEIFSVSHKTVKYSDLDKDGKSLYRTIYGAKEFYDLYEMIVRFEDDRRVYLVSSLGYSKVND